MSYQALARRWRPLTFDAVVAQGPIVRTLQNALQRERIAHAYLFAGPRGVGKTTTARLPAMGLNCTRPAPQGPVPCAACEPCREIVGGRARGVAVHAAARIASLAGPGQVLVSGTTRDMLDGSGLSFSPSGEHELKGLSGARPVFALQR